MVGCYAGVDTFNSYNCHVDERGSLGSGAREERIVGEGASGCLVSAISPSF